MRGLLGKALNSTDSIQFWIGVFMVALVVVLGVIVISNRRQAARNQELIREQQTQLSYLCETVNVLDVSTAQQLRVTRDILNRKDIPVWADVFFTRRENILSATHDELADARGCRQVE